MTRVRDSGWFPDGNQVRKWWGMLTEFLGRQTRTIRRLWRRRGQMQIVFLRLAGADIAKGVTFNGGVCVIGDPSSLTIGLGAVINENVTLNCRGGIKIGSGARISNGVHIVSTTLNPGGVGHTDGQVVIGDGVWIASGVVVGRDCKIVSGAVVGANSVVLNDLDVPGFYAGAPARLRQSA